MRSSWVTWVGPKSNDKSPYKTQTMRRRRHRAEGHMKTEAKTGGIWPPREAWSHQKLLKTRKDHPVEPLEGDRPCRHLDFVPPVSRTARD